jgi:small multidrug resistance family-3 protein
MSKLAIFGLIVAATAFESVGDALVRLGLKSNVQSVRLGWFALGGALLFAYGLFLNLPPVPFGRIVGLYIASLFVMFQIVNLVIFRTLPTLPVLVGGALVVAGGLIVAFWEGPTTSES